MDRAGVAVSETIIVNLAGRWLRGSHWDALLVAAAFAHEISGAGGRIYTVAIAVFRALIVVVVGVRRLAFVLDTVAVLGVSRAVRSVDAAAVPGNRALVDNDWLLARLVDALALSISAEAAYDQAVSLDVAWQTGDRRVRGNGWRRSRPLGSSRMPRGRMRRVGPGVDRG